MSVEFDRGSPRNSDSMNLNGETLDRWTGRKRSVAVSQTPVSHRAADGVVYTIPVICQLSLLTTTHLITSTA